MAPVGGQVDAVFSGVRPGEAVLPEAARHSLLEAPFERAAHPVALWPVREPRLPDGARAHGADAGDAGHQVVPATLHSVHG